MLDMGARASAFPRARRRGRSSQGRSEARFMSTPAKVYDEGAVGTTATQWSARSRGIPMQSGLKFDEMARYAVATRTRTRAPRWHRSKEGLRGLRRGHDTSLRKSVRRKNLPSADGRPSRRYSGAPLEAAPAPRVSVRWPTSAAGRCSRRRTKGEETPNGFLSHNFPSSFEGRDSVARRHELEGRLVLHQASPAIEAELFFAATKFVPCTG